MNLSFDFFKQAMDTMGASIVILEPQRNRHGTIIDFLALYMNDEARRTTNAPADINRTSFLTLTGLDKNSAFFQLFAKTMETGQTQSLHSRLNLTGSHVSISSELYDFTCTPFQAGLTLTWQKNTKILQTTHYSAAELFQKWDNSFSVFELYVHDDGREDLRLLAANRTFADLISHDYETLPGKIFSDVCTVGMDWLPFYIKTAKTGVGDTHESYNYGVRKFLTAIQFSPAIGQVALLVIDRTRLWQADLDQRTNKEDFAMLFASLPAGVCVGRLVRDESGTILDARLEMVNSAYELLEGFPTSSLQGKLMADVWDDEARLDQYVQVIEEKTKIIFNKYIPLTDTTVEVMCFSHVNDVFICIENNVTARIKAEADLLKSQEALAEKHSIILDSISYASKIQRNLLPPTELFQQIFSEHAIIWQPRDVVGGDIYWLKSFEGGSVLCMCDCTGHGAPGAFLTMLVVSALSSFVTDNTWHDPARTIWELEQRLIKALNVHVAQPDQDEPCSSINNIKDGCDLAVLSLYDDGTIRMASGNTHVFLCDGNRVTQIKGQKIFVGEGKIESKDSITITTIAYNKHNKFYIASDGFFDQIGEKERKPFAYQALKRIILEMHSEPIEDTVSALWNAFERHRGQERRRDDVQLIAFQQ